MLKVPGKVKQIDWPEDGAGFGTGAQDGTLLLTFGVGQEVFSVCG